MDALAEQTHIRTARGTSYCGEVSLAPRESVSLQHWQVARRADDWMGLRTLPVPMCEACVVKAPTEAKTLWEAC